MSEGEPTGQGPEFTPKQQSRLEVYRHIVERVEEQWKYIEDGQGRVYGKVGENGNVIETYFRMDADWCNRWRNVADNMREQEFSTSGEIYNAAVDIEREVEAKYYDPNIMTTQDLEDLFNRE